MDGETTTTGSQQQQRGGQPWWLAIVIEWVPLAVLIYLQYPDECRAFAGAIRDRLFPARDETPDTARLEWHRARFQAGGYADDGGPTPHHASAERPL